MTVREMSAPPASSMSRISNGAVSPLPGWMMRGAPAFVVVWWHVCEVNEEGGKIRMAAVHVIFQVCVITVARSHPYHFSLPSHQFPSEQWRQPVVISVQCPPEARNNQSPQLSHISHHSHPHPPPPPPPWHLPSAHSIQEHHQVTMVTAISLVLCPA